ARCRVAARRVRSDNSRDFRWGQLTGHARRRTTTMADHFGSKATLRVGGRACTIYRLDAVEKAIPEAARLPFSLKVLLQTLLRNQTGLAVRRADVEALARWQPRAAPSLEIAFTPARVLPQDFTGVPCVVDLAAMRDAMQRLGGDPKKI